MRSFLDKIFFRSNNLDFISQSIKDLSKNTPANKIFNAINNYSKESEVRYVGGCIRKILNKEKVDDVDMATNLEPKKVCDALKKNNIDYYETGINHGTITAMIDSYKFEITSLREDIFTDGRHANVKFSKNWKQDASRRDFTINSIYADAEGNLFDPYDGKMDLEKGVINFIGDADERIKEDYLRILRYLRFFLFYSKYPHSPDLIRKLKLNIKGVSKLSKERLLDELKKFTKLDTLEKLSDDQISLDLILMIFPELKNIKIFSKLRSLQKEIIRKSDFIFLISLMIIDVTKLNNEGKVIFGSTVFLENLDTGEKIDYKIVGKDEADLKEKLIYYQSPIGKGLIGKNKDDLVEIITPAGKKNFEIKDVKYT